MKGRTGFVIGIAAGYVLGARAGRPRYEQITAGTARIRDIDTVQAALDKTEEPRSSGQLMLAKGLRAVSRTLRSS